MSLVFVIFGSFSFLCSFGRFFFILLHEVNLNENEDVALAASWNETFLYFISFYFISFY